MDAGVKKHLFNTVFFAILALPSLVWAIQGSLTLINHYLTPHNLADNVVQTSVSLPWVIAAIFINMILPIILTAALIFHIMAFYKSDLNGRQFNTEFIINFVLACVGVLSLIFYWIISLSSSPEIGMILIFPFIASIIALIISIIIFFVGYYGSKIRE